MLDDIVFGTILGFLFGRNRNTPSTEQPPSQMLARAQARHARAREYRQAAWEHRRAHFWCMNLRAHSHGDPS